MQAYDFDTVYPRVGMASAKWDDAQELGCPPDVVPLSIADMEFPAAPVIRQAMVRLAEFGMWGYSYDSEAFKDSIRNWMHTRHGWRAENGWMLHTSGVVHAMYVAVRALTPKNGKVVVQPPVYHPFFHAVQETGRTLIENRLMLREGRYEIDFSSLEKQLDDADMMFFCNPHNPVGRVWKEEDVRRVAELCAEKKAPLFSDEIHSDLIMPGQRHFSAGHMAGSVLENTMIATSASKTFSLAGLSCATLVAPGEEMRERMAQRLRKDGFALHAVFGNEATRVAYSAAADWLDAVIVYIDGNYQYLKNSLAQALPGVKLYPMEGTYLAWMDFSALGLAGDELIAFLEQDAHCYLNDGRMFGAGGENFARMNLACPRVVLEEALQRLFDAAKRRGISAEK